MERPVLVMAGPDRTALDIAVSEASARQCGVVALLDERPAEPDEGHGPVEITWQVVTADASSALIQASMAAQLLVLSRAAVDEATVERVAAHSACPVLSVDAGGHRPDPHATVVLALDARAPAACAAAEFAFDEALRRGVSLTAIYVAPAQPDGGLTTLDPFAYDSGAAAAEADRLVAEAVAGWSERFPDVVVHRRAFHDADIVKALASAAADAGLLVVLARDHPRLSERLLGTVTSGLIRHATCPIAVVPGPP